MKTRILVSFLLILSCPIVSWAQESPAVLPMKERAEQIDQWLEERIQVLLPQLMEETGIDMWILISREYNEDPVIRTFLPATWLAARRRTILLMYQANPGGPVETHAIARYDVGKAFKRAWDPEKEPDQWKALMGLIAEKNPKKIGLNFGHDYGHADGLAHTDYALFHKNLPKALADRVVSAQTLAVRWLETRTASEWATYPHIQALANSIIQQGLSEAVITPGKTTTEDVVWWYRDRIQEMNLDTWFHPTVDIQRPDPEDNGSSRSFASRPSEMTILPGDLLHIDFGISYLRLNTDTQQLAYVLKPGETAVPQYLQDAFLVGNRLQDILTGNFKTGITGNELLEASLTQMKQEGIAGSIYTHPLGFYGHAAGPTIGMWDNQEGIPGSGDHPIHPNTAYAIELNARVFVKEWKKEIRIMLEEGAFFDGERVTYFDGRQRSILPIPRLRNYLGN